MVKAGKKTLNDLCSLLRPFKRYSIHISRRSKKWVKKTQTAAVKPNKYLRQFCFPDINYRGSATQLSITSIAHCAKRSKRSGCSMVGWLLRSSIFYLYHLEMEKEMRNVWLGKIKFILLAPESPRLGNDNDREL